MIESFSRCLQACMKEHLRSAESTVIDAHQKNSTTAARILKEQRGYHSWEEQVRNLLNHPEEKREKLFADSFRTEKDGLCKGALSEEKREQLPKPQVKGKTPYAKGPAIILILGCAWQQTVHSLTNASRKTVT